MPLESEAFSETHFPWPIGVCASSVHALGFFTPNIVLNAHPVILHCAQFTFASDKVLVADVRIHNSSLKHKRVCLLGGVDSMEGGKWIQTDSGRSSQGQFQNHTVKQTVKAAAADATARGLPAMPGCPCNSSWSGTTPPLPSPTLTNSSCGSQGWEWAHIHGWIL